MGTVKHGRPAVVLLVILSVLALALIPGPGCGAKRTEAPQAPVTLTLAGWTSSPTEEALVREALEAFMTANPAITVNYQPIEEFYLETINQGLAQGTAPDVFYLSAQEAPDFISRGVLLDLDDYMHQDGVAPGDFYPNLIEAFRDQGSIYAIPKDFNTLGLFYNRDLLDRAGVKYPDVGWTWEDLALANTRVGKAAIPLPAPSPPPSPTATTGTEKIPIPPVGRSTIPGLCLMPDPSRWLPFALQNGARILSSDGHRCLLDSPQAVGALGFYTTLLRSGAAATPDALGVTDSGQAFAHGRAAMVIEGGWLIPSLRREAPGIRFGVVELPRGPVGRGNLLFTVGYAIPRTSKNPTAAWKLVNFLTGVERQEIVLRTGFALPSRIALIEDPYYRTHQDSVAILRGVDYSTLYRFGTLGSAFNYQLSQALKSVLQDKVAPGPALTRAVEGINSGRMPETVESPPGQ